MNYIASHTNYALQSLSQGETGLWCASCSLLVGSLFFLASKTVAVALPLISLSPLLLASVITAEICFAQVNDRTLSKEDAYLTKGWVTAALATAIIAASLLIFHLPPVSVTVFAFAAYSFALSDLYQAYTAVSRKLRSC